MTHSFGASAHAALPRLVERFTLFLRTQPHVEPPAIATRPEDLAHVLDMSGHHIVVLALVARADNKILPKERQVIIRYCVERAARLGHLLSEGEKQALQNYLSEFYPPLALLDDALERLKLDSKADLDALLEASHEVIGADHIFRMDEVSFLHSLRRELAAL